MGARTKTPKPGRPTAIPADYEAFTKVVQDSFDELSPSYRRIARHLTQNPNEVAIQSINEVARQSDVHASSVVRFAQHFGFRGFKDLQALFQSRLTTAAPGFGARVAALRADLELHSQDGLRGFLGDLVARDIASLERLLADTNEEDLEWAVGHLATAGTVYVVGQLRSAPVASFLRYVLTMLRRRAVLLDANGGLATEMARVMGPSDVLIAVSFRYYAKEVVRISDAAAAQGVPIIAITDGALSPLAKSADVLFPIPEDTYSFSRSLAAPMCLAQALMIALAARLEPDSRKAPRIPVASAAHGTGSERSKRRRRPDNDD